MHHCAMNHSQLLLKKEEEEEEEEELSVHTRAQIPEPNFKIPSALLKFNLPQVPDARLNHLPLLACGAPLPASTCDTMVQTQIHLPSRSLHSRAPPQGPCHRETPMVYAAKAFNNQASHSLWACPLLTLFSNFFSSSTVLQRCYNFIGCTLETKIYKYCLHFLRNKARV